MECHITKTKEEVDWLRSFWEQQNCSNFQLFGKVKDFFDSFDTFSEPTNVKLSDV